MHKSLINRCLCFLKGFDPAGIVLLAYHFQLTYFDRSAVTGQTNDPSRVKVC